MLSTIPLRHLALLAWSGLVLAAEPTPLRPAQPLRVVASTPVLADLAAQVGGWRVAVEPLVPRGVDPHAWQPVAGDVQRVARAQVVLTVGLGLEANLSDLLRQAGGPPAVVCAQGIVPLATPEDDDGDHDHGDHAGHDHGPSDPHVWMDPANAVVLVRAIQTAFAAADPAGAADYAAWAEGYTAQIRTTEAWARRRLATIPPERRVLVVAHESAGYFGRAFQLDVIGVAGLTTGQEPDARRIAQLAAELRRRGVTTVFPEPGLPPQALARLAAEAGAVVGPPLYTDTLGEPGTQAGNYLGLLLHDAGVVAAGLGGK